MRPIKNATEEEEERCRFEATRILLLLRCVSCLAMTPIFSFVHVEKIFFYFLHPLDGLVRPGALMVFTIGRRLAASTVLCIFSGIPPQRLPLRLVLQYHIFELVYRRT